MWRSQEVKQELCPDSIAFLCKNLEAVLAPLLCFIFIFVASALSLFKFLWTPSLPYPSVTCTFLCYFDRESSVLGTSEALFCGYGLHCTAECLFHFELCR